MKKSLKNRSQEIENQYGKKFEEISHYIFRHPELGGEEEQSAEYLVNLMRQEGFRVTQPYAGEKTGFRAEIGKEGGLTVAFLAEYDALPGFGAQGEAGHACGHNWISAVTAGAALVLSKMISELNGKVVLIGTPAEESYGGKACMIEEGGFDDIDVVMQAHLDEYTEVAPCALAMSSLEFQFCGKAAHAAQFPHLGINALDAVQLTFAGINALRQHVTQDVRIHGIITNGGAAANVVPEYSACQFYVRALKKATVEEVVEKVINCAKGAALMTGAGCKVLMPERSLSDLVDIPILVHLAENNLVENGVLEVHRVPNEAGGSSDIGNVSYCCPTVYMEIALAGDARFLVHDATALEYADAPLAYERMHQVIKGMAGMAIDLFENQTLAEQAKLEHRRLVATDHK